MRALLAAVILVPLTLAALTVATDASAKKKQRKAGIAERQLQLTSTDRN